MRSEAVEVYPWELYPPNDPPSDDNVDDADADDDYYYDDDGDVDSDIDNSSTSGIKPNFGETTVGDVWILADDDW